MKKKTKRNFIVAISLAVVTAIIGCCDYYMTFYNNNISDDINEDVPVKIYRNFSFDDLCDAMKESGALKSTTLFRRAAINMKLDEGFKPGYYRFHSGMNNKAIIRVLANGWQQPVKVSFNGYIRSLESFAKILSSQFEADSSRFATVLRDTSLMSHYGFEEESFIGMFIPNTYEFYWTTSPEEFVDRMFREYNSFWTDERLAKAKEVGLTQKQVSTLAAIVIEETKYEPEMSTIAGVYINRLRKGIPLQADPTVKFAMNIKGITRILNRHLKTESPYNTYRIKGLPPGPITMPPIVALDAVLNYQRHNYIYFCARETFDGQHNFASTMSQHKENARKYHRALNAREQEKRRANS